MKRGATESGSTVLEWLELADGTTREALAERLAQAHLIDYEFLPAELRSRATARRDPPEPGER